MIIIVSSCSSMTFCYMLISSINNIHSNISVNTPQSVTRSVALTPYSRRSTTSPFTTARCRPASTPCCSREPAYTVVTPTTSTSTDSQGPASLAAPASARPTAPTVTTCCSAPATSSLRYPLKCRNTTSSSACDQSSVFLANYRAKSK